MLPVVDTRSVLEQNLRFCGKQVGFERLDWSGLIVRPDSQDQDMKSDGTGCAAECKQER